jgi:thiamine biosynthesis lipoprotein ApbE
VTVAAPDAAEAEAHSTALAITPVADARAYIAARPWLAAVIVPHDGAPFRAGATETARTFGLREGVPA